jgi:hypothetical protein
MDPKDFPFEEVYNIPLADQPVETWLNSIMVRLAVATGDLETNFISAVVNPDDVLIHAEEIIWRYRELEK